MSTAMSPGTTPGSPPAADTFPRWLPPTVGLLLLVLLLVVGGLRLSGFNPSVAPGSVVAERHLRFTGTPAGAVLVHDAGSGQQLAEMSGEQGFLRGILRSLARERRAQGVGPTPPYRLSRHADGRLLITDTDTGLFLDLTSFGPDNAAVFARWLPQGASQP
jgi:putative photosynthetic complex assembly protein